STHQSPLTLEILRGVPLRMTTREVVYQEYELDLVARHMTRRKKVVCAMSGGVDSSVAAALLLREGFEVVGVFMRLGSPDGVEPAVPDLGEPASVGGSCDPSSKSKQGCCSVLDAQDARRVAAVLDIPLYVLNFQEDFSRVIDYFVNEYNRGR